MKLKDKVILSAHMGNAPKRSDYVKNMRGMLDKTTNSGSFGRTPLPHRKPG